MNDTPGARPVSSKLSLRDTKEFARSLHEALKASVPTHLAQCQSLVQQLWDFRNASALATDSTGIPLASHAQGVGQATSGDVHNAIVDSAGSAPNPDVFIPLGKNLDARRGISGIIKNMLSPTSPPKHLSWTHQGGLGHAVMFGAPGSGQQEALFAMMRAAAAQDTGLFYFNCHGFSRAVGRARALAADLGQPQRLRLLDMTALDAPTHTFNPFARGSALELTELFLGSLRSHLGSKLEKGVVDSLQIIAWVSSVFAYLVWGRQLGLWSLDSRRLEQGFSWMGIQQAMHDVRVPQPIKTMFVNASRKPEGMQLQAAYAPVEAMLVTELLAPVNAHYGHIMHTQSDAHGLLRPELDMQEALEKKQWIFIEMPAAEKYAGGWQLWPGALAFAQLAILASKTGAATAPKLPRPSQVRTWLVATHTFGYVDAVSANQVSRFGPNLGLGCLWADQDYPAFKRVEGMSKVIEQCQTKIFMKMADPDAPSYFPAHQQGLTGLRQQPSGHAHIIFGSCLHRVALDYRDFEYPYPPFAPAPFPGYAPYTGVPTPVYQARVLHERLAAATKPPTLAWCQETVARMLGFSHWHDLTVSLAKP